MYTIRFYKDRRGRKPVQKYIRNLSAKNDIQSQQTLKKIHKYLNVLALQGTMAGLPYVRHIEGEIWELRPARERILFVACLDEQIFLLHNFTKTTQKTPRREIETAKRRLKDLKERGYND